MHIKAILIISSIYGCFSAFAENVDGVLVRNGNLRAKGNEGEGEGGSCNNFCKSKNFVEGKVEGIVPWCRATADSCKNGSTYVGKWNEGNKCWVGTKVCCCYNKMYVTCSKACEDKGYKNGVVKGTAPFCGASGSDCGSAYYLGPWKTGNKCYTGTKVCCCSSPPPTSSPSTPPTTSPSSSPSTSPTTSPSSSPSSSTMYYIETRRLTWNEHNTRAKAKGYSLASVHSVNDLKSIPEIDPRDGHFIGGKQNAAGKWFWSDGSPWDFTKWAVNEPNNRWGTEDCVEIVWGLYKWNDVRCTNKQPAIYKLKASATSVA